RSIEERSRNFRRIDETDDVDRFGCLDFYLCDFVRLDQRVTIRLVLIALGDLIVGDDLTALLAALVISDWTKIFAVQLVELNSLGRFDRVINANRNRNKQKTYVTFPNRSHRGSSMCRKLLTCVCANYQFARSEERRVGEECN